MFGNRYFAARYFGNRYYGGVSGAQPSPSVPLVEGGGIIGRSWIVQLPAVHVAVARAYWRMRPVANGRGEAKHRHEALGAIALAFTIEGIAHSGVAPRVHRVREVRGMFAFNLAATADATRPSVHRAAATAALAFAVEAHYHTTIEPELVSLDVLAALLMAFEQGDDHIVRTINRKEMR